MTPRTLTIILGLTLALLAPHAAGAAGWYFATVGSGSFMVAQAGGFITEAACKSIRNAGPAGTTVRTDCWQGPAAGEPEYAFFAWGTDGIAQAQIRQLPDPVTCGVIVSQVAQVTVPLWSAPLFRFPTAVSVPGCYLLAE